MAASLSLTKEKKPAYSSVMRRMTSRMNQLHDELALESVTNIEFEQSSRRSFEFLQSQLRTLKEAFNTLTDTILEEIDFLSGTVRGELWRLDERQTGFEKALVRDSHDQQLRLQQQLQQCQQQTQQLQQHSQQIQQHSQQIQQHSQQLTQQTQQCQQQSRQLQQQSGQLQQQSAQLQQISTQIQQQLQQSHQLAQQSQQMQHLPQQLTQQLTQQITQQLTQQLQQQLKEQFTAQLQQELAKHSQATKEEISSLTTRVQDLQQQQEKGQSSQIQQLQMELQRYQTSFADLEKRAELMAQDLDTVLGVVPKVEDTMLKTTGHLQERISGTAMDVSKLNDAVAVDRMKASGTTERLETRMKSLESDLREELEQKHLKLQRSITRQLESMSRALIESDRGVGGMPGMHGMQQPDVGLMGSGHRQVDFDMPGMDRLDPMQQSMPCGFGNRGQ
ncbi:unnamed protein product [Effrenium voratum]|uniref:Uncharacterized protein n=1 Tax=Effrenium voratum TaxID=2562239 RepID=A0AA36IN19_9DINO|nr:unnamed protein product [Effrenium voratum]CAJ1389714.1 unnamed protein product [Effrenium voratum]CAJ1417622.1 unnamed protein product [Effrenium voratum]